MKVGMLVLAVLAAIAVLILAMQGPKLEPSSQSKSSSSRTDSVVEISPTPPYPKAMIDETTYRFGVMEQFETKDHAFVIRNQGQAPLKLVGTVQGGGREYKGINNELVQIFVSPDEIPPGNSGTVRLQWKPSMVSDPYHHNAQLHTNDPLHKTIELQILGSVKAILLTIPRESWIFKEVSDEHPSEVIGTLYSPLVDHFNIVSLTSTNPFLTAEATPLSRQEVDALVDPIAFGKTIAKSGYTIRVRLKPGLPIGRFDLSLDLKTDVRKRNEDGTPSAPITHTVYLTGRRDGPIQFFGPNWLEEKLTVVMGEFDATLGKKVVLNLFVTGDPPDGLKILKADCVPKILEVDLQPGAKMKGKTKRYVMTFTFPPGIPKSLGDDNTSGKVKLHTNHPHAGTMEFKIDYRAY